MGRYAESHITLNQALQLAHDAATSSYQSLVLVSLGDLYNDIQLRESAFKVYQKARQIGGTAFLISYLDLALVRLLIRQRQFPSAARMLQGLSEATLNRQETSIKLLTCAIKCGLRSYKQAETEIEQIISHLDHCNAQVELAQAYLIRAQIIAAIRPADTDALITSLDKAAAIAKQLGYDAFLIAEAASMRSVLRRAEAAGWTRATDWLERIQHLHVVAQTLNQDEDPRPTLVVRTIGADQILLNGELVEIGGWLKAREVFYYLLANPNGATYETLQEAIWPELGTERSRSVKDAIYQLRSALPRDLIEMHGRQLYKINRNAARIDYDVERFLELCDTRSSDPEGLLDAVDLYRGAYLPWSDNEWSGSLRAHLEQRYLHALRSAAAHYDQAGAYADALDVYRRILAIDELDEAAHAGVMRCQMQLGNRAAAINQYMSLQRTLDKELGLDVERASEVEQLYRRILSAP
jgi:DNA-binding SARP family transcriptional activator